MKIDESKFGQTPQDKGLEPDTKIDGVVGDKVINQLTRNLISSRFKNMRLTAAWQLGRSGGAKAQRALMAALKTEEDKEVLEQVILSLGFLKVNQAKSELIKIVLEGKDPLIRRRAVWALSELESKADIVETLIYVLENEIDWLIREEVCWALGKIKDETAVFQLETTAIKDSSASVRKAAIWALGEIDSVKIKKVAEVLLPLETNPEVKKEIIWVLAKSGNFESLSQLYSILPYEKGDTLKLIIWAIGKISAPQSWTILEKIIQDGEVSKYAQEEAVWVMTKWAPLDKIINLLPLLKNKKTNLDIKKMIIWALTKRGNKKILKEITRIRPKNSILKEELAWAKRQIELK